MSTDSPEQHPETLVLDDWAEIQRAKMAVIDASEVLRRQLSTFCAVRKIKYDIPNFSISDLVKLVNEFAAVRR